MIISSQVVSVIFPPTLQRGSDLFHYARQLVETSPESALSWFAVGCYYYIIKKFDQV